MKTRITTCILLLVLVVSGYSINKGTMEVATFGNGCFWCTEAVFKELKGVEAVRSGYSGGDVVNPSYKEVTTGRTGHAEVIEIDFDPTMISFNELLEVFFATHDPTTLNRQGADVGTQYRSAIFYRNETQKRLAEEVVAQLNKENVFEKPVVTEITKWKNFFNAENYHQDYYANNPNQGYCKFVIVPKLDKFRKIFKDKLK